MASAATVSLIMLLLLGLVLVGFVVGIVLWATGGRARGKGEMACGGCGYSVRGLEQLTCPECGADLRAVGISGGKSGGRRVTGIVLTAICGLVLLSCVGLGAFGFLFASAPAPIHNSTTTTIQSKPQAVPVTPNPNPANDPPTVSDPAELEVDDPAVE